MGYVSKVTASGSTHLVGSTLYGTCATAAATAAKIVTCADFDTASTEIPIGLTIHIKFTNSNTASAPTLNINSGGAIAIKGYGTTAPGTTATKTWYAGAVVSFTYDGTNWLMNDYKYDSDTDTKVTQNNSTADTNYQVLLSNYANTVTTATAAVANKTQKIYANPSTGLLHSTILDATDSIILNGAGVNGTEDNAVNIKYTRYGITPTSSGQSVLSTYTVLEASDIGDISIPGSPESHINIGQSSSYIDISCLGSGNISIGGDTGVTVNLGVGNTGSRITNIGNHTGEATQSDPSSIQIGTGTGYHQINIGTNSTMNEIEIGTASGNPILLNTDTSITNGNLQLRNGGIDINRGANSTTNINRGIYYYYYTSASEFRTQTMMLAGDNGTVLYIGNNANWTKVQLGMTGVPQISAQAISLLLGTYSQTTEIQIGANSSTTNILVKGNMIFNGTTSDTAGSNTEKIQYKWYGAIAGGSGNALRTMDVLTMSANSVLLNATGTIAINTNASNGSISIGNNSTTATIGIGNHNSAKTITLGYNSSSIVIKAPPIYASTQSGSTVTVASDGTLKRTSSSIRYKNILSRDLDKDKYHSALMNFEPVEYEFKTEAGVPLLGMIAEEVAKEVPIVAIKTIPTEEQPAIVDDYQDRAIISMLVLEAQRKDQEIQDLKYLINQLMEKLDSGSSLWN